VAHTRYGQGKDKGGGEKDSEEGGWCEEGSRARRLSQDSVYRYSSSRHGMCGCLASSEESFRRSRHGKAGDSLRRDDRMQCQVM
jgi:hypothetical protein